MKHWILDRFEEDMAVFETDDGSVNLPRAALPCEAREGDCFLPTESGLMPDPVETARRRERIRRRSRGLFSK